MARYSNIKRGNPAQKSQYGAKRIAGLSLVELMVALALGLLVVAGMIQLFTGNRATFNANEALARVQENGRFSMEILRRETRAANFYGVCAAVLPIRSHLNTGCAAQITAIFEENRPIIGWEFMGTGLRSTYSALAAEEDLVPSAGGRDRWQTRSGAADLNLPDFLDGRVVPGSDVLLVRLIEPVPGVTAAPSHSAGAANIDLTGPSSLVNNELALVTNCSTGVDLFQNTAPTNANRVTAASGSCASPGPGNRGLAWSTAYGNTMQLSRVRVRAYYIGYNALIREPGLWRADLSRGVANPVFEELVSGVETLQILYGYSRPANQGGDGQTVDDWLTADQVPDWRFVIAVRIAVVVRSSEGMSAGSLRQTFDLAGTAFTHPEDVRLRHPFVTTLSLRNQQLVH